MNNKKPKLSKYYIATAKRLLKYVTETYKARFILVFVCIFLSAVASISVSLSFKIHACLAKNLVRQDLKIRSRSTRYLQIRMKISTGYSARM